VSRADVLAAADARLRAARLLEAIPPEPAHLVAERRAVLDRIGARPAPRLAFVVSADVAVAVPTPGPATCACRGSGWVCEDHPGVPYAIDLHFACPCDAPGAPCPHCNAARLLAGVTKEPTR
jgi:hypothetical protein